MRTPLIFKIRYRLPGDVEGKTVEHTNLAAAYAALGSIRAQWNRAVEAGAGSYYVISDYIEDRADFAPSTAVCIYPHTGDAFLDAVASLFVGSWDD